MEDDSIDMEDDSIDMEEVSIDMEEDVMMAVWIWEMIGSIWRSA